MDPKFVRKLVTERSFDASGALIPEGQIGTFDENRLTGKEPHIFDVSDTAPVLVEQSAIAPTGPNPTMPQQIPPDAIQGPGGAYVRPGVILTAERTMDADQRLAGRLKDGDTSEGDLREELRRMGARTGEIRGLLEQHRQTRETAVRAELASVSTATSGEDAGSGSTAKSIEELEAEIARLKEAAGSDETRKTENDDDPLVAGTVRQVTADLGTKTDDELNAMLKAENDREQPRKGVTSAIQTELDARAERNKQPA